MARPGGFTRRAYNTDCGSFRCILKPVIVSADPDSELSWLIHHSRCGRVVPTDDPQAYTDAVIQAFHDRLMLAEEGERGRRFVVQEYSKEAVAHKYDKLIRQLTET